MPGLSKDIEMDYSSDSNSAVESTQADYDRDEVATLRQLIQTLTQTVQRNEHRIQGTGSLSFTSTIIWTGQIDP